VYFYAFLLHKIQKYELKVKDLFTPIDFRSEMHWGVFDGMNHFICLFLLNCNFVSLEKKGRMRRF